MRRLLGVLALLALPICASGKTLIIGGTTDKADATYGIADDVSTKARVNQLTRILDAFGASYKVVHPSFGVGCRVGEVTEWARTGLVRHNCSSTLGAGAFTEQFDAVIVASFTLSSSGRDNATQFRPESLSTVTKVPTAPVLLLGSLDARQGIVNDATVFGGSSICSLGVSLSKAYEGAGSGSGAHDEEGVYYQHAGVTDVFCGTANMGRQPTSAAQVAGKGFRTLLAHGSGPIGAHHQGAPGYRVWSSQWDSTGRQESPDTAQVWMVQDTHVTGAKPIICAGVASGDQISDDAGGVIEVTHEMDVPVLMVALAALDSASGGLVFDNKAKLPLKVAITVDGLCARSGTTNSGGILPSDTTRFYGTLDSLTALDVPVAFGVNIDSIATYPRDLQYAMTIPKARFSPQGRGGLDSAAAGNGVASQTTPRDAFRRYRNSGVAVGPYATTAADTSLYALLLYAREKGEASWGASRSSRFALPPDDDWSPYNFRKTQMPYLMDSLFYAYRLSGYKGIRINGSWSVARANTSPTNPRGYYAEQQSVTVRFGGAEAGDRFKLLAHNGSSTFGSVALYSGLGDSSSAGGDYPQGMCWSAQERFWQGLFGYTPLAPLGIDGENATGEVQKCRIFRVSAQELAGPGTNTWKHTQRPGWWAIRQVVMPIRIMNRLAGRSIMAIDYPENCEP